MMRFLSNKGVRTGLFFGATSGVITTLGLMTGLNAGTHSLAAVLASVAWGMFVITVLSYFIARVQNASAIAIIAEHLAIALLVVVLSHFIGVWVGKAFG